MTTPSRYTFSPCQSGEHDACSAAYINGAGGCASQCDCSCHARRALSAVRSLVTVSAAASGEQAYLLTALRAARELPEEDRYAVTNTLLRQLTATPRAPRGTPVLV